MTTARDIATVARTRATMRAMRRQFGRHVFDPLPIAQRLALRRYGMASVLTKPRLRRS